MTSPARLSNCHRTLCLLNRVRCPKVHCKASARLRCTEIIKMVMRLPWQIQGRDSAPNHGVPGASGLAQGRARP